MENDVVMTLYAEGYSYSEIATRTSRTRGSVAAYIRDYKKRGGPPPSGPRKRPTIPEIRQAMLDAGGELTAAAVRLGVSRSTLRRRGFVGLPRRGPNLAEDPETLALVDAIDSSGLTDRYLAEEIDMAEETISRWRRGKCRANPFLAQCVRTVLERQNTPGY